MTPESWLEVGFQKQPKLAHLCSLRVKATLLPQIAARAAAAKPSPYPRHTAGHVGTWQRENNGK